MPERHAREYNPGVFSRTVYTETRGSFEFCVFHFYPGRHGGQLVDQFEHIPRCFIGTRAHFQQNVALHHLQILVSCALISSSSIISVHLLRFCLQDQGLVSVFHPFLSILPGILRLDAGVHIVRLSLCRSKCLRRGRCRQR